MFYFSFYNKGIIPFIYVINRSFFGSIILSLNLGVSLWLGYLKVTNLNEWIFVKDCCQRRFKEAVTPLFAGSLFLDISCN